jgi:hypothetical protein
MDVSGIGQYHHQIFQVDHRNEPTKKNNGSGWYPNFPIAWLAMLANTLL